MENIIDRIRHQRMQLNISYDELSKRTGLAKSTLQRYETGGIKNLPLSKLEILARGLETTSAYIMGWDEKEIAPFQDLSESETLLIQSFNLLNEEGQDMILAQLQMMSESNRYIKNHKLKLGQKEVG